MSSGYIYLMHVREFQKTNVYKIGRSKNIFQRAMSYPKGSRLLFTIHTMEMRIRECQLIKMFCISFKARPDIGREYFEGDLKEMQRMIMDYIGSFSDCEKEVVVDDPPLKLEYQLDPTIVIMEFVDSRRSVLSECICRSKDLYAELGAYLKDNKYDIYLSHTMMSRVMVKSYGVKSRSHRFPDGVDQALEFPNLLGEVEVAELLGEVEVADVNPCKEWLELNYEITDDTKVRISPTDLRVQLIKDTGAVMSKDKFSKYMKM